MQQPVPNASLRVFSLTLVVLNGYARFESSSHGRMFAREEMHNVPSTIPYSMAYHCGLNLNTVLDEERPRLPFVLAVLPKSKVPVILVGRDQWHNVPGSFEQDQGSFGSVVPSDYGDVRSWRNGNRSSVKQLR